MWATIQNIFRIEELRERIIFTLFMLFVFRIGAHIPTPGIDGSALTAFFEAQQGSILRFFDMFTGGALARLTVFALGVMPYISASIIMQLLTVVFPYLERLSKEGDAGRRKITAYTRYGTIVLSLVQSFAISVGLESMAAPDGSPVVISTMSSWGFRALTVITLTAGTAFLMWVGERVAGPADAAETPIGLVPTVDAIDRTGLDLDDDAMTQLLAVDPASWGHEVALIDEHYAMVGDRLPKRLDAELDDLRRRLDAES